MDRTDKFFGVAQKQYPVQVRESGLERFEWQILLDPAPKFLISVFLPFSTLNPHGPLRFYPGID
jgi:hypothetical protein